MPGGLFTTDQERWTNGGPRGKRPSEDNNNNNNILKTVASNADKVGDVTFAES